MRRTKARRRPRGIADGTGRRRHLTSSFRIITCRRSRAWRRWRWRRGNVPHTPFILVSGTIGEQAAIESLKAGAADYVLKQQSGTAAVRRAPRRAGSRGARETARGGNGTGPPRKVFPHAHGKFARHPLHHEPRRTVFITSARRSKNVLGYEPEELHRDKKRLRGCIPRICRACAEAFQKSRWKIRTARQRSNCATNTRTANGGGWNSSATTDWRTRKSRAWWPIAAT